MVHKKVATKGLDSQQIREAYLCYFINKHVIGKILYIQPLIKGLMNRCSI